MKLLSILAVALLGILFLAEVVDAQCSGGSCAVSSPSSSRTVIRSREGGRVRLFRPFARLRGRCG